MRTLVCITTYGGYRRHMNPDTLVSVTGFSAVDYLNRQRQTLERAGVAPSDVVVINHYAEQQKLEFVSALARLQTWGAEVHTTENVGGVWHGLSTARKFRPDYDFYFSTEDDYVLLHPEPFNALAAMACELNAAWLAAWVHIMGGDGGGDDRLVSADAEIHFTGPIGLLSAEACTRLSQHVSLPFPLVVGDMTRNGKYEELDCATRQHVLDVTALGLLVETWTHRFSSIFTHGPNQFMRQGDGPIMIAPVEWDESKPVKTLRVPNGPLNIKRF